MQCPFLGTVGKLSNKERPVLIELIQADCGESIIDTDTNLEEDHSTKYTSPLNKHTEIEEKIDPNKCTAPPRDYYDTTEEDRSKFCITNNFGKCQKHNDGIKFELKGWKN